MNPVLLKELRVGLRERRIFAMQVIYLVFLLCMTLLFIPQLFHSTSSENLAEAGKNFFEVLFWVQLWLLIFTMPALTCGAISGERERHSLDMVLASRLSSADLVWGKLGFALYCLTVLLFSALPLASISFFLGGVGLMGALRAYLELFLFGTLAACAGLFFSAREQRSNYATAMTYLSVLASSVLLIFYGALRSEEASAHLTLGPYWWTGQMVIEMGVFHYFVGLALYLIALVILKARHRVRPQALNVQRMGMAFVGFFLFNLSWVGLLWSHWAAAGTDKDDIKGFSVFFFWLQTVLAGCFFNPSNLESEMELKRLRQSPFGHRGFWLLLFALFCLTPGALCHSLSLEIPEVWFGFGATLFFLGVYPLTCEKARQALLPGWQFGWVYYLGLALMHFLPALGALSPEDSFWRLRFVSPALTLMSVLGGEQDRGMVGHLALAFHLAILVALSLLARWRQRRRA